MARRDRRADKPVKRRRSARSGAAARPSARAAASARKTKRSDDSRTPTTLQKISPQLNVLLSLGLPAVRRLALAARAERRARNETIEKKAEQLDAAKSPKRRAELERQINKLIDEAPNSSVHGVYFPTDKELKDDAPPVELEEPFVSVFLKSHCMPVDLERLGIRVRTQAGDIFSTFVPWELLTRLAAMPGIDYIELARPMRSALDVALPYNEITNLKSPPSNLTGAGVIVGVIDTFLCFYHMDFRDPNPPLGGDQKGSTRVLFIWDQALTAGAGESGPTGIPGFTPYGGASVGATYGVEYSQTKIQKDLDDFRPPPGQLPTEKAYLTVRHEATTPMTNETRHGTQVCGIAAGNGRATPPAWMGGGPYPGAAPKAAIIFVRNTVKNSVLADSTTVTDAFAYVFARAAMEGKPCVVNMSQSDNLGPHDGTSLGEEFLDHLLLTPGRAITVAAGNTNDLKEHTSGKVAAAGQTNVVTLSFSKNAKLDEYAEIWYDGQDVFAVTLTIPTTPPTVVPIAPNATPVETTLPNGVKVTVVHTLNDARNGDNVIALSITDVTNSGRTIPNGDWTFQLTGTTIINGAYEAWVDRNNRNRRKWLSPDSTSNTVAVPATGLRVIAVGGHDVANPKPPDIIPSSGVGPSRDDRVKPDIAAVGDFITSPSYLLVNSSNPGDTYEDSMGTSMAAPLVAGTIALLFQCRLPGLLTWSDVKQLLKNTAGVPGVGVPSHQFGWGYLKAANICATPTSAVDVWIRHVFDDGGLEPFTGLFNWLSSDIKVLDLAGNAVSNPTHHSTNFVNNIVKVTVRNRGAKTARNVEVYLYWADPATNIPFSEEWRVTGIFTGDPNFVLRRNKIVVPELAAGTSTDVLFGWAPPAPASSIRGDDHFCLLARIEQEVDPSNVSTGGRLAIAGSNNIARRSIHVQQPIDGVASSAFYVTGSDDHDALEIETDKLGSTVELIFPVQALPWRDLELINRTGKRHPFGADAGDDPLARETRVVKEKEATLRTGIEGLTELRLAEGNAHLIAPAANPVRIPEIRVKAGVKMPMRLIVRGATIGESSSFVHVRHRSGGNIVGGVTLELARELARAKPMTARLEGEELVVRPL